MSKIQAFNEALKLETFIPKDLQEPTATKTDIFIYLTMVIGALAFGITGALITTLLQKIFIK